MNIDDYKDYESLKQEYYILLQEIETLNYDNFYLKESYDKLISLTSSPESMLSSIDFNVIESYIRKHKLNRINDK